MGIRSLFNIKKKKRSPPTTPSENSKSSSLNKLFRQPSATQFALRQCRSSPRTSTQIEELEHVFRKFDANGDGKISWSELGSIMGSLGEPASEEELKKMIKGVDSDGDGFIDLGEFIELNMKDLDDSAQLQDLKDAFLIFDLDRNGAISPDELHTVLKCLGDDSTLADCKRMIKGVDCDGDGLINFEEFKIMMMGSAHEIRG